MIFLGFFFRPRSAARRLRLYLEASPKRCRFLPYLLMSIVIGTIIYPIYGHWVWGGGWLGNGIQGFRRLLGGSYDWSRGCPGWHSNSRRAQWRFDAQGRTSKIPASNMPLVAIGVVILTFGWIGFNGGSAALSNETPMIITNTIIAACFGGLMALLGCWAYGGLAAVENVLNGVLGGLVAITACADVVDPQSSMVIGLLGGLAVPIGAYLLERMKLDDAVGAVPVHGLAGIIGIIVTPLFMNAEILEASGHTRGSLLGVQSLGVIVCCLWSYILGLIMWRCIGLVTPLRIGPFEEQVGLNYSEHKVASSIQDLTQAVAFASTGRNEEAPKNDR